MMIHAKYDEEKERNDFLKTGILKPEHDGYIKNVNHLAVGSAMSC